MDSPYYIRKELRYAPHTVVRATRYTDIRKNTFIQCSACHKKVCVPFRRPFSSAFIDPCTHLQGRQKYSARGPYRTGSPQFRTKSAIFGFLGARVQKLRATWAPENIWRKVLRRALIISVKICAVCRIQVEPPLHQADGQSKNTVQTWDARFAPPLRGDCDFQQPYYSPISWGLLGLLTNDVINFDRAGIPGYGTPNFAKKNRNLCPLWGPRLGWPWKIWETICRSP